jgi:hypothetical protein
VGVIGRLGQVVAAQLGIRLLDGRSGTGRGSGAILVKRMASSEALDPDSDHFAPEVVPVEYDDDAMSEAWQEQRSDADYWDDKAPKAQLRTPRFPALPRAGRSDCARRLRGSGCGASSQRHRVAGAVCRRVRGCRSYPVIGAASMWRPANATSVQKGPARFAKCRTATLAPDTECINQLRCMWIGWMGNRPPAGDFDDLVDVGRAQQDCISRGDGFRSGVLAEPKRLAIVEAEVIYPCWAGQDVNITAVLPTWDPRPVGNTQPPDGPIAFGGWYWCPIRP